jgi:MSHA biogenesis protein MshL
MRAVATAGLGRIYHMKITGMFSSARGAAKYFMFLAMLPAVGGCSYIESLQNGMKKGADKLHARERSSVIDKDIGMTRDGYTNALLPDNRKPGEFPFGGHADAESKAPEIAKMLVAPEPPSFGTDKLVTLSVTQDVPVKDVLVELASNAEVDMEIDPGIAGGVILNVKDKPFSQVIDRIARLAGLRYEYDKGILRVERDMPYQKNYSVDFLNITRSGQSSVSINTQVLGGGGSGGSGGGGLTGGSGNAITASYDGDAWASVSTGIQSILDFTPAILLSESAAGAAGGFTGKTGYTVNKQAGVISIMATDGQHRMIDKYLQKVKESVSSQVLIEAKVVEVTLDDKFNTGIDWGVLQDQNLGVQVTGSFNTNVDATANFLKISGINDLKAAVTLTEEFGTSRTLSSPRLHAMNNQQAILTFAENFVYFTIKVQEETNNANSTDENKTLTVDSQLNTVPVGVILTLQPSINMETQEVTMNVRPTLSRITDKVRDPGVDIVLARNNSTLDVASEIPVIEVRELDSVLKIRSGEVMVIGGLMREINTNNNKGVPFASALPFVGNAFKSIKRDKEVIETIIFIKATIVPSQGVRAEDQRIYNTFMPHDPRPLTF